MRAVALFLILLTAGCAVKAPDEPPRAEKARFADLPGWASDNHLAAWRIFTTSCPWLMGGKFAMPRGLFAEKKLPGWRGVCQRAGAANIDSDQQARAFFETYFSPWRIIAPGGKTLFTGYYEAELTGASTQSARYAFPVYARPDDLVTVSLGRFDPGLPDKRIVGRVRNGALLPYPDRAAIEAGAVAGKARPVAWVDSAVDLFFLHVQGSGRIRMADGNILRVGFAASNGRPYTAIGRTLIRRGALSRENVSMQSIRHWLAENPAEAQKIMATNARYIFFRKLDGPGPVGSLGVELSPGRSMAVDPSLLPLGAPVWLDTTLPGAAEKPLRRLMLAQDTGAAIKGAVRGDVFFGFGKRAARLAGNMKFPGGIFVLLPRKKGAAR